MLCIIFFPLWFVSNASATYASYRSVNSFPAFQQRSINRTQRKQKKKNNRILQKEKKVWKEKKWTKARTPILTEIHYSSHTNVWMSSAYTQVYVYMYMKCFMLMWSSVDKTAERCTVLFTQNKRFLIYSGVPVVCVVSTFENLLKEAREAGKQNHKVKCGKREKKAHTKYVCQKLRIFRRRKITENAWTLTV